MSMSNPEFDARVARIASGQASSKSTIFVGLDEVYHVTYARRGKSAGPAAAAGSVFMPVFVMIAMGLGVASFGLATWVQFYMAGGTVTGIAASASEMAVQAGAALAVALLICRAIPFRARMLKVLLAGSAVGTMFLYHNAVHLYPDSFAQVFSQGWVEDLQASTKPQSVVWQGQSYTF